jgi:hypothetical protein
MAKDQKGHGSNAKGMKAAASAFEAALRAPAPRSAKPKKQSQKAAASSFEKALRSAQKK